MTIQGVRFQCARTYRGAFCEGVPEVHVYHRNPFSRGRRGDRPVLDPTGSKLVIFGHAHYAHAQAHQVQGALCVNVSSLVSVGGPYSYRLFDLTESGAVEVS